MESQNNFLKYTYRFLIAFLVGSSVLYFFSFITADPDLWGHLMFGKEIWTSKDIPHVDMYSYTAYGLQWINHEWLSEMMMWLVFMKFGSPGLLIAKMLIGFIVISAISIISYNRKSHVLIYCVVFMISTFIMSPGFMIRPQLMTFLFTSLFFLVIHFYLEKRFNLLWTLPLLMFLWVNSHGGFIIGAGILPIIVILELLDCLKNNKDRSHLRVLILWVIITDISLLINPYGLHILTFLYKTLTLPRNISEWEPITLFDFSYMRLKIFSLGVIFSFFINKNKNRYWEIGIIIVAMLYAFLHQRHTPILAIFAAPFLTEKLSEITQGLRLNEQIGSQPSQIILATFFAVLTGYQLFITINKYINTGFNIIVDSTVYPVNAIQFLKTNSLKGNLLVPFDWGEYAVWKLYPDNKVSIDGRFDTVYPGEVIDAHFNAMKSEEGWNYLLNKYPTDIILARRDPFSIKMINKQSNWIYIYSDKISIIFLKRDSNQKEIVKKKGLIYPTKISSIYFP
jgi:hypothetical protein